MRMAVDREMRSRRVLSKCITTEDEDTLMGQSAIDNNDMRSGIIRDPVLWQQETERVALKLQLRKGGRVVGRVGVGQTSATAQESVRTMRSLCIRTIIMSRKSRMRSLRTEAMHISRYR